MAPSAGRQIRAGLRPRFAAAAVGLWVAASVGAARAQVVERHLPPPPPASSPRMAAPPSLQASEDDRPIGPDLRGIVLVGPVDRLAASDTAGLDIAATLPRLQRPDVARKLQAFFGRPISRRLISQIEATVVRVYRRQGFPFVEVSTPAQEISGGVVQLRVIEFHIGQIAIRGAPAPEAARIAHGLRLASGEAVDDAALTQDLDWLGRYPFRQIEPAFTPGAEAGESNLELAVVERRPSQIAAGYDNSGSSAADQTRYFVGATVGGLLIADSLASVQITGSPDFWASHGGPFGQSHPTYESAAGRLIAPVGARSDVELSLDAVETNQSAQAFIVREQTLETALVWRAALANLVPLPGDVRIGVELKSQRRMTFFGPTDVLEGGVNVFQGVAGWSDAWSDRLGHSTLDLAIRLAPGGLDRLDDAASLTAFTSGRVRRAAYVYADLDFTRLTSLGQGFALSNEVIAQYAGGPIPDSEQASLGGQALVRGYLLDVGAFDDAVVVRDSLRAPLLGLASEASLATTAAPFAFLDFGCGRSDATGQSVRIAAIGFGADLAIGRRASANLDLSYPLVSLATQRGHDWRLEARLDLSY